MTVVTVAEGVGLEAAVRAQAADRTAVTIRAIRPGDRPALARLYGQATPESLRLRFFDQPSAATLAAEVDQLCRPETDFHQSVLAIDGTEVVGVASSERTGHTGHRAEFSVFVADGHRGRGIGTLLLEHLSARAARRGIGELIGTVLWDNVAMLRVARNLSSDSSFRFNHGAVEVRLKTRSGQATGTEPGSGGLSYVPQWACSASSRVASTAACVRRSRPSLASRLDT